MPVLCMINQKSGCGKSSSCFHLAGAFAADDRRVLLIDADPQGSISQGFFGSEVIESLPANKTLAVLYDEELQFVDRSRLILETPVKNIDIVLANSHLADHNSPRPELKGDLQYAIRDFLEEYGAGYDIVLIDCPPNLYTCSWTAMIAADHVLIPVPPEDFGTQGIRAVHQAISNARVLNPGLRRLGHLLTRVDNRLIIHRRYEEELRSAYGNYVLDTVIPEASAFKVALTCRMPVQFSQGDSKAARLTRQLAAEIDARIASRSPKPVNRQHAAGGV